MARLTGSQRRKRQAESRSNREPAITIKKGVGGGQGNKKRNRTSSDSSEKAAWLKKTRNSPAAKAGISDDMRWKAYQRNQKGKSSTTKSSKGTSSNKNLGKNTKVTSSKGKTTYETTTRARGLAGIFGKKNKKKLTVPNLSNLK